MAILECDNQIRLSRDLEKRIKQLAAQAGHVVDDIKSWDDLWEAMLDTLSDEALFEVAEMMEIPIDDLKAELESEIDD